MPLEQWVLDELTKLSRYAEIRKLLWAENGAVIEARNAVEIDTVVARIAAEEKFAEVAARGGIVGTAGGGAVVAGALPVITQVGVFVALGAGIYEARAAARNEETVAGFSYGLVCGMVGWTWHGVTTHFLRKYFKMNHFDDEMDAIRVNSFNRGLLSGFLAGHAMSRPAQMMYLRQFRADAGIEIPSHEEWTDHSRGWNLTRADQAEHARAMIVRRSE